MRAAAPVPVTRDIALYLREARSWSDAALEHALPAQADVPGRLHEALRYALFGGGKRLRPAIVRLVGEQLGAPLERLELPASAIEFVHTYSLVHDDLPCMDDDDLRRGRPTCHKVYGEALAVLVGDALLTEAFGLLACEPRAAELVRVLAAAAGAGGMVGGQGIDLETTLDGLAREQVEKIHALKTAALLGASAELGAVAAGVDAERCQRARRFGRALGLAFQAIDDILDVTGDAHTLGKTPGKDARALKPTLVAVLGLEGARREAERLGRDASAAASALGSRDPDMLQALVEHVLSRQA